ncbi:MAG: hypothetical protein COA86_04360 [Kangiella sp.]|nr:MAG: hypothetical protein COA86_04360 [Kangiella sp.]
MPDAYISYGGAGGEANLNYTVEGMGGSVEVYVYATELADSWELKELLVVDKATGKRLVIITQSK